jgi:hypothetical protein
MPSLPLSKSQMPPEDAQRLTGCEVTPGIEGAAGGGMNQTGSAELSGRLEPLHLELTSPHRLVRILGSVVWAQPLLMASGKSKFRLGSSVRSQLVRHEHLWREA